MREQIKVGRERNKYHRCRAQFFCLFQMSERSMIVIITCLVGCFTGLEGMA